MNSIRFISKFSRIASNNIPKPVQMVTGNYIEPEYLKVNKLSRIFKNLNDIQDDEKIGKLESSIYKNPEYFSYHPYSYYNVEEALFCKRCRTQASPFKSKIINK
jgi:hypothetical protein